MWIGEFYINSKNRELGVFPKMLHELEKVAEENDYSYIGWMADKENINANKVYQKILNSKGSDFTHYYKKVKNANRFCKSNNIVKVR